MNHMPMQRGWSRLLLLVTLVLPGALLAAELPRRPDAPDESLRDVETRHESITVAPDVRIRAVVTRPADAQGRLPAVLFVAWLSCDSTELSSSEGGWNTMIRGLIEGSGAVVMRTDKRGVGDSEGGPCSALDYETDLADQRLALDHLRAHPWVDPDRIVVYGASMGANMAPLLAAESQVAGVAVWGGGATTWFERTLAFERNALELGEADPANLDATVRERARFLTRYLLEGHTPAQIAQADPALGRQWAEIVGTGDGTQYGRPLTFHQQAARQNWAAAWARVDAPVLVLYGEYDWFERADAHALIADIVRANGQTAQLEILPGIDHHFTRYPDARSAFKGEGGKADAEAALRPLLGWLRKTLSTGAARESAAR
jgi:hypothetical protein